MTKKHIIGMAGLLGAVIIAAGAWPRESSRDTQSSELQRMKSEIESLRADQAANRHLALLAVSSTRNQPQAAHAPMAPDAQFTPEESRAPEPPPPTAQQWRDILQARFSGDDYDPSWSRDADAQVSAVLARIMPKDSKIGALECKSTMCRLEVSHLGTRDHVEFMGAMMRQWEGPTMITLSGDTGPNIVSVAFLGRPGVNLAPVERTP